MAQCNQLSLPALIYQGRKFHNTEARNSPQAPDTLLDTALRMYP